jgi:hypothetical protein
MADEPTGADNVVERWDRGRVISRTLIVTGKQSRRWIAPWLAAVLATTAVLAVCKAPAVAYLVPALALLVAAATGTHLMPDRELTRVNGDGPEPGIES